ncbi:MAG: XRE family transcriptional regulator [Oscillatoria sp. Prado101]|jgi:DNA-binding Xre family transcriptional regulator|nr:XRE family transcriptional regulator [Oscillatoria sp. Prado101]
MSRGELVRLRSKELAAREDSTLKEVADRSGVPYSTVKTYAVSPGMTMIDLAALLKLARTFDFLVEDLLEVIED